MTDRTVWFTKAAGPLTCGPPSEQASNPGSVHVIRDPLVWNNGCLRCTARLADSYHSGPRCGRLLYLFGGDLRSSSGVPMVMLARVTVKEMQHLIAIRAKWAEALDYLGLPHFVLGES